MRRPFDGDPSNAASPETMSSGGAGRFYGPASDREVTGQDPLLPGP